ncbi:transcriptional regulator GlxA family with amidase domain [Hydrogenophaga palleronii]|uniref:Transcriptional regulator GlxA family with amidase domain n=1 Tax=Hydrogenophaga palleronii TaxID=65655 RepID=A0ABU1WUR7_9BURK|nr:DJ-1/PfpI family protein [Hydrogenophaga palleronii]MDR7153048.1 transcriptional regulator GlxA family with amidase domain [Hydrogenophaga palleronii]
MKVAILAFDQVEALDLAGPYEVFTTASRMHQRESPAAAVLFDVHCVAQNHMPVRARAGLTLLPTHAFEDAPAPDVLIVPGGVVDDALTSTQTLAWIARADRSAQITASVCTGAFLLAASGVLTTGEVTTHWEDLDDLARRFPALTVRDGVRWVDQGRVVTSAGISAGIDMSLHLVARLAGMALAERTAHQMDFQWTRA